MVEVDLVGERDLAGGVSLQALKEIEVDSQEGGIEIVEDSAEERVIGALQALWSGLGLKQRAQLDNGGELVARTG